MFLSVSVIGRFYLFLINRSDGFNSFPLNYWRVGYKTFSVQENKAVPSEPAPVNLVMYIDMPHFSH